ncbi:MAG: helix-turn-helix domain-containing protein [Sarcina sp.]
MDIGKKLKLLRIEKSLTQEELAHRCELSKGFISQIENNLTSPSIATLIDILNCLGTNLQEFFNESKNEQIAFSKEEMFEKKIDDLGYKITWLVPNAQKNEMEPVLITLRSNGKYKLDSPHEGEEFGYVLSGSIYLHLGNKKVYVKKEESFYFIPKENHYVENAGKSLAKIIWVSTPPSF